MKTNINKFLYDIQEAIESIESYIDEIKDFNIYKSNKMIRRAVEREFEIIGEALNSIDKLNPQISISSKSQIIGMRNRIIHGYDKIDDEIVWGTIIRHLPVLKNEVVNLMKTNL